MKHQTYWSFIKYTSLLQVIIKVNHSKLLSKFNEKICVVMSYVFYVKLNSSSNFDSFRLFCYLIILLEFLNHY